MQIKMKKISGDASFREFYRIQKNSGSSILVKANKDRMGVIKGLKDKEMRNELKRKEEQIENSYNQEVKEAHVSKAFGRSKI